MHRVLALVIVAVLASSSAYAGKGVRCGNSYIAAGKTCHKPTMAKMPGKKCGKSYIAADKTCHK